MPIYVFQCRQCRARTEAFFRSQSTKKTVACSACGSEELERVVSQFAIYRSEQTHLEQLDPKYHKMVDDAMAKSEHADPMRLLNKMTPFSAADDPGDPINF